MNVGDEIFLLICIDRHVDVAVSVHTTRQSADAAIESFKASYDGRKRPYVWTERDDYEGWLRYVETNVDDGPYAYIERTKLQG